MFQLSMSAGSLVEEKEKPPIPHNRSARFGDDDSAAFLQVTDDTTEVDFYKNPTILSRLLLNHNYASAIKRLRSHPEEASVWVAHKRNPFKREEHMRKYLRKDRSDRSFAGSIRSISSSQKSFYNVTKHQREIMVDYSLRQLPIHMACGNLIRPSKPEEQATLEKLISLLILNHPDGCKQRDHDGKLPLHEAIWYNASAETITMMLIAYPSSLHERDKYGRSPLDLNRIRSGGDKEKVKELLIRGVHFWEQARSEALANMKGEESEDSGGGGVMSAQSLRADPGGKLTPVVRDVKNQVKNTSKSSSESKGTHDHGDELSVVEPISWVKLEQRAVYLEQLLAGMYEKNYELGETVEELTRERVGLQEELDKLRKQVGRCDDESIAEENENLREEIAGLKRALSDAKNNKSTKISRSIDNEGSVGSLEDTDDQRDAEQIQYLQEKNGLLEEEVNELNGRIQDYESQVNRLEIIAGMHKIPDRGGESDADSTLASIPEETSPGRPVAKKEGLSSPNEEAREDLDSLLGCLSANSRFATERYLAGKIVLLEERLNEEMEAREADVRANNNENERLLMENEALQSEVNRLSSRNIIGKPSFRAVPKSSRKELSSNKRELGNEAMSSRSNFSEDPSVVFQTDDLDEILQGAAAMYNSRGSFKSSSGQSVVESVGEDSEFDALLNEALRLYGTKQSSESLLSTSTSKLGPMQDGTIGQIRDEVVRIESAYGKPVPLEVKMSLVSAVSSISLGTKQSEDEDEELDAFLEEAAKFYGKPIPSDLRTAMQGTSLMSLSERNVLPSRKPDDDDDLGKIFEEAERLYQRPIPADVQAVVRDVVISGSGRNFSDDTLPTANLSPTTSSSLDADEELLMIIREAEKNYGKSLPADLKYALLTASTSSGVSFRSREGLSSADGAGLHKDNDMNEADEADDIEKLFDEAEKAYSKPIPSGVKVVMRNAMSSRVELDRPVLASPILSPETSSSLDTEDELVSIIREAERAYGRSLPSDLKHALLTASISSGMSLRSLGESSRQIHEGDSPNEMRLKPVEEKEEDLEKMFEDAMRLYRRPIPTKVKAAMREAVSSSVRPDGSSALHISVATPDGSSSLDPYDELESIIGEAERAYGKSLSPELKHALLTASISSRVSSRSFGESPARLKEDDNMEKMFEEAAILYRQPIPTGVKAAMRSADLSPAKSSSFESYDELQSIIREAEKTYGQSLSPDLKHALLTASISSRVSMRSLGDGRDIELDNILEEIPSEELDGESEKADDDDELERMFKEATILYQQPIPTVVRDAVSSSFRRVELASSSPTLDVTPTSSSSLVDPEDELESIIRDAERAYGKSLPEDLKQALLTASISSGLSFRSLGEPDAVSADAQQNASTVSDDLNEMFIQAAKHYSSDAPVAFAKAPMSDVTVDHPKTRDMETPGISAVSGLTMSTDLAPSSQDAESRIAREPRGALETDASDSSEQQSYLPQRLSTSMKKSSKASNSQSSFAPDDDLESIIREAEATYGKSLPDDLKHALRNASVTSGLSFRTNDLLGESSRLSGVRSSESHEDDLEKMFQQAQYKVFQKGPVLTPVNVDEDDDLEKLFEEAARLYDKPIPKELMSAMRNAVSPSDGDESSDSSVSSTGVGELESNIREGDAPDAPGSSQSELLFDAAQVSSKPFLSENSTRDEASMASAQATGKATRPVAGVASDDLDELFAEAAKGYGSTGSLTDASRPSPRAFLGKKNRRTPPSGKSLGTAGSASMPSGETESDDIEVMLQEHISRSRLS